MVQNLFFIFWLVNPHAGAQTTGSIFLENTGIHEQIGAKISLDHFSQLGLPILLVSSQTQVQADQTLREVGWVPGRQFAEEIISDQPPTLPAQLGFSDRAVPTVVVLTPDQTIYRYFYGSNLHAKDLRFALIDASNGKVGSAFEHALGFCFHYVPARNAYTVDLYKIVAIVLIIQGAIIAFYLSRTRAFR